MPFTFTKLPIPGLLIIEPEVFTDERGYFAEIYKITDFENLGVHKPVKQANRSFSRKNVLRGLHYQINPMAQYKIVEVNEGEIFDVAVDIRKDSPAYGKWHGQNLSAKEPKLMFIPVGFAHGFCVLSETATVTYYCSEVYSREHERGILWSDPDIAIDWPVDEPKVSEKDKNNPLLKESGNNFTFER